VQCPDAPEGESGLSVKVLNIIGTFRITTYDGSLKKSYYAQALPET